MKTRSRFFPFQTLCIIICFFLFSAGCDIFMGPEGPVGPEGPAGPAGTDGEDGADGADGTAGEPGGNVPGGVLNMSFGDSITVDTVVRICFDPDQFILSGNETTVDVPLVDYLDGGSVNFAVTWHAPAVTPGSYYVYAWVDLNGDSIMDAFPNEQDPTVIYDPLAEVSGPVYSLNFGSGQIEAGAVLMPNYTFWNDYASEINFYMNYGWV